MSPRWRWTGSSRVTLAIDRGCQKTHPKMFSIFNFEITIQNQ